MLEAEETTAKSLTVAASSANSLKEDLLLLQGEVQQKETDLRAMREQLEEAQAAKEESVSRYGLV